MHWEESIFLGLLPRADRMPNRRKTSKQVTKIEMRMRMMIMYVRPRCIELATHIQSSAGSRKRNLVDKSNRTSVL